jgi:hypothetical protein
MADKTQQTIYHFLVAYDYTLNTILVGPTKYLESATIITAFDSIFQELQKNIGFKPQLNITDNEAVTALKEYLHTEDCAWQFVENPITTASTRPNEPFERSIYHFISGVCTTDKDFPLQL